MTDSVLLDISDSGVATVTLNRAEKHNAFDDAIIEKLTSIFQQVDQNKNVRVMVLQANGKSFCAGADLGWMQRMANYSYEENLADANALAEMLRTLNFMTIPTIAKVQGAAFGGAVGLVACCDIAIASEKASFCLSEVKLGLIPATISPYVIDAMGPRHARRYFQTAERFFAQRACDIGLVSEVTSVDQLDDAVVNIISQLLNNGPVAVAAAKQLVFDVSYQNIEAGLIKDTSERIANIRVSKEGQEGLNAFLEKRSPEWMENN